MATMKGLDSIKRFRANVEANLRKSVLPGAARAGGKVIQERAQENLGGKRAHGAGGTSVLIADSVHLKTKRQADKVTSTVHLKGEGSYVGRWLEYGTSAHFISVDKTASGGRSARRVNDMGKEGKHAGTLIIGGKPVGTTVHHPGARPVPFMRPALDLSEVESKAAAQAYITSKVKMLAKAGAAEFKDDDV